MKTTKFLGIEIKQTLGGCDVLGRYWGTLTEAKAACRLLKRFGVQSVSQLTAAQLLEHLGY